MLVDVVFKPVFSVTNLEPQEPGIPSWESSSGSTLC